MTEPVPEHALYSSLASWWPLISPPQEYVQDAALAAALMGTAPRPVHQVLELGCGGGHTAVHLSTSYELTLVDISEEMLAVSRTLNPGCEHLPGDMREIRLDRDFDAVLVHDAIDYMTSLEDLRRTVETAHEHCRPGGMALFMPDHVRETYLPGTDHGGSDGPDGRGARYLEWSWDPDPSDTWVLAYYTFLLRDRDGAVRTVTDRHVFGLFSQQEWLDVLLEAGFEPAAVPETTSEDRAARVFFAGYRV